MSGLPDDFIVIDPDDPDSVVDRRRASLRVVEGRNRSQGGDRSPVAGEAGSDAVGEHAIPKAETQAHTSNISPGPLPRLPAADKTPHVADKAPTFASASAGGGGDLANGLVSGHGVMHQISETARHELNGGTPERTTSGFAAVDSAVGAMSSAWGGIDKAADNAAKFSKAMTQALQGHS